MITKGVWIDDPPRDVITKAFWDKLPEHGIKTAALMLEGYGDGFDPSYTVETLEKIKALALERDIEVVLTTWPEPTTAYMEQFRAKIGRMLAASGAAGLEFDCEGNWLGDRARGGGYPSLDVAGDHLVELVMETSKKYDVRSECTTYPFHVENSRTSDVAPHMDRLLPQAYSVRKRTSGDIAWDSPYGPGGMQRLTLDRAKQVLGVGTTAGPLISCGLAAYDQTGWPGHTPEEAMRVAYDAAKAYEPIELRFWSSKWIFGFKSNGYASRFLKSVV